MTTETLVQIPLKLSIKERQGLKVRAAKEDKTMQDIIRELVQKYLERKNDK